MTTDATTAREDTNSDGDADPDGFLLFTTDETAARGTPTPTEMRIQMEFALDHQ